MSIEEKLYEYRKLRYVRQFINSVEKYEVFNGYYYIRFFDGKRLKIKQVFLNQKDKLNILSSFHINSIKYAD